MFIKVDLQTNQCQFYKMDRSKSLQYVSQPSQLNEIVSKTLIATATVKDTDTGEIQSYTINNVIFACHQLYKNEDQVSWTLADRFTDKKKIFYEKVIRKFPIRRLTDGKGLIDIEINLDRYYNRYVIEFNEKHLNETLEYPIIGYRYNTYAPNYRLGIPFELTSQFSFCDDEAPTATPTSTVSSLPPSNPSPTPSPQISVPNDEPPIACENICRTSASVTEANCKRYSFLGCKVRNCFSTHGNGKKCTKEDPPSDFTWGSWCINPYTYGKYYNNGYNWKTRYIFVSPSYYSSTGRRSEIKFAFSCDRCRFPCSRIGYCGRHPVLDAGSRLNLAGVTRTQAITACRYIGRDGIRNRTPIFDCSNS